MLVETWLKKFIYSNIEPKSKVILQQIISNNVLFLSESTRFEHFNELLSGIRNNIYEQQRLLGTYNYKKLIKVDRYRANIFYDK